MTPRIALKLHREVNSVEWDKSLARTRAQCFHASRWQRFATSGMAAHSPLYLEWEDRGGAVIARATASAAEPKRFPASFFAQELVVDAPPATLSEGGPPPSELLAGLLVSARAAGFVRVHFAGYGSTFSCDTLRALGFAAVPRFEFVLELREGEEACWNGLKSKRRNKIRRARRDGVKVRPISPGEAAEVFTVLQRETVERIRARGVAIDDPPATELVDRSFSTLVDSNLGILKAAVVDGRTVAIGVFGLFNRHAYYLQSAASEAGLQAQAPSLLIWETIAELAASGGDSLNLGGCSGLADQSDSPEHGLYVFKRDFGAERIVTAAGDAILLPLRHRAGRLLKGALDVSRRLRGKRI